MVEPRRRWASMEGMRREREVGVRIRPAWRREGPRRVKRPECACVKAWKWKDVGVGRVRRSIWMKRFGSSCLGS